MYKANKRRRYDALRLALLMGSITSLSLVISACGRQDATPSQKGSGDLEENDTSLSSKPETRPVEEEPVPEEINDNIAIQVNDRVTTREEFDRELQRQMDRFEQQLGGAEQVPEMVQRLAEIRGQMKQQLVQQQVTRLLLEDYLAQSDVEVNEDEVDQEWSQIAGQFPDEKAFEEMLQQEGMSVAEAREQVARQVKLEKVMAKEVGEVEVTDAEAQAFFDERPEEFAQPTQVRARHILLKDGEGAEKAIEALHERIVGGEDFEALAREHSECPSSEQGGDLGFFGENQMVEPFSQKAFAMQPGEVSSPIQTQFGYHIIKVEERREAKQAEFGEVQEAIKEHLGEQRARSKQDEFIEQLKKNATITINVDLPAPQPAFTPEAGGEGG